MLKCGFKDFSPSPQRDRPDSFFGYYVSALAIIPEDTFKNTGTDYSFFSTKTNLHFHFFPLLMELYHPSNQ